MAKDIELYYLKTRFYNPILLRFITPDSIEYLDSSSIIGLNLYAYCWNQPIMYSDPNGCMPDWLKWVLGIAGGPVGFALVGAEEACSSSIKLGKNGWETFGWTVSGVFVGNAGVVATNWDEVLSQSNYGYMQNKDFCNFYFDENTHYSLWTSLLFSTYMKSSFYSNDSSRSVAGIDFELLIHYGLYSFGITEGTNGAWIQKFSPTPEGVKESKDGILFEALGLLWNPILYFFR